MDLRKRDLSDDQWCKHDYVGDSPCTKCNKSQYSPWFRQSEEKRHVECQKALERYRKRKGIPLDPIVREIYKEQQRISRSTDTHNPSRVYRAIAKTFKKRVSGFEQLKKYQLSTKSKYRSLIHSAKSRNLALEISFEQYEQLINNKPCFYCKKMFKTGGSGLDRKNNNLGYTIENVLVCCPDCNRLRSDNLSVEEMIVVARTLRRFREKREKEGKERDAQNPLFPEKFL